MGEFDREKLKAALEAGRIAINEDSVRGLDRLLQTLVQQYRARKFARVQDLKGQLTRLGEIKNFLASLWDTEPFLYAFEVEMPQIINRLLSAVQRGLVFLKTEKEQRKVRGDDPETILFMDLRDIYVGLSGKTGISEDGPLHRFATACADLIDANIILPQAQSLRKALKRRAKAPHIFGNSTKINNDVHPLTGKP